MMKTVNGRINKADVRVYPEIMKAQIELLIEMQCGSSLFKLPATADAMTQLHNLFSCECIGDITGKYCRVGIDELGNAMFIQDLIYDYDNSLIAEDAIV